MDLGTVQDKLQNGGYESIWEVMQVSGCACAVL